MQIGTERHTVASCNCQRSEIFMERLGPRLKRARSNFSISSGALLVLLVFLFYLDRMPTQGHGEWPFPEAGLSSHIATYPFVRRIWCSDHWRPPDTVKMMSNECCDDVGWRAYLGRDLTTQPRPSSLGRLLCTLCQLFWL
jgi:hypothetical protein